MSARAMQVKRFLGPIDAVPIFPLGAMQDHLADACELSMCKRDPRLAGRSSTTRLRAVSLGDILVRLLAFHP